MDILDDLRTTDRSNNPEFFQRAADEIERLRGALRMIEAQAVLIGVNECSRLAKDALTHN